VLAKQERVKANKKLKDDLETERKEMGKVLMTNRQRKLYQQAADEVKEKKDNVKKLKVKRKSIEKKK
jgi:pescadillo protein